jgi:heptosyltransferase-2
MRTLIIAPDSLSDAVMTQPLVALLRRLDPLGRIDVLARPAVAAVFEAMADVTEVFASHHAFGPLQPWGKYLLARRLDCHRHDRVYVLPTAKRAALVPWLAGIPIRIGLHRATRWGLINQPHDSGLHGGTDRGRQAVERFAHLAFDATHPLPGQVPNPTLLRNERREAAARSRARLDADAPLLVLNVGAENAPSRRWPARHWASLISRAADEWPDLQAVLVGEASDRDYATEIGALSGRSPRNLCGGQCLADAIAIVAQADAVVSHDCGLMHVAAAYARPMVAVFGPTDPRFAPPRSPRAKVEWLHQDCSPCNAPTCRYGHGRCMAGVSPESVLASLRGAMRLASRDIR